MAGIRLTVVDCGPLNPEANMLVAFAPGKVAVVTTVGIIEHPKHGRLRNADRGGHTLTSYPLEVPILPQEVGSCGRLSRTLADSARQP